MKTLDQTIAKIVGQRMTDFYNGDMMPLFRAKDIDLTAYIFEVDDAEIWRQAEELYNKLLTDPTMNADEKIHFLKERE